MKYPLVKKIQRVQLEVAGQENQPIKYLIYFKMNMWNSLKMLELSWEHQEQVHKKAFLMQASFLRTSTLW